MSNNIGEFIKELRKEKKWSQEYLARKLYVDRTTVNKWENSKSEPDKDKYNLLCEVFNISIIELLSCKKETKDNKLSLQRNIIEYLKKQDSKYKKMKIITVIAFLIIMILISSFAIYYFVQNYKSIKVYNFEGNSKNYKVSNGFLLLSKQRIFFKLGKITPEVKEISIYNEKNNKKNLVYRGDPYNTIVDIYGYNSLLSYEELDLNNSLYIEINDEIIKLNFVETYVNDNLFFRKKSVVGDPTNELIDIDIPPKIKKTFECDKDNCNLIKDKVVITYNIPTQMITVMDGNVFYQYSQNNFLYIKDEINFEILNDKVICNSGNCSNAKKIYDYFYHNYILLYLS